MGCLFFSSSASFGGGLFFSTFFSSSTNTPLYGLWAGTLVGVKGHIGGYDAHERCLWFGYMVMVGKEGNSSTNAFI